MTENDNNFIGIDVSKATLDIVIGDTHYKIKNTKKDIDDFIKSSISLQNSAPRLAVVEATGGYERLVMVGFCEANIPMHMAHPNRVHAFAKARNHFAKTDKLDAKLLRHYAEFVREEEKGDIIISATQLKLQQLKSLENNMMEDMHAYQCRLEHAMEGARDIINQAIAFLKGKVEEIRDKIRELVKGDEELSRKYKLLVSFKGVGEQTANSILAELPELGSMNHKEVASMVGLAPKTHQSGNKSVGGHIFGGRFYVRKALYMAALVAMRFNAKMKVIYERLIAKGKPAKIALVAIMRKIVVNLNAMLKNNEIYS